MMAPITLLITMLVIGSSYDIIVNADQHQMDEAQWKLIQFLKEKDKCGAFYQSKSNGYQLEEFKIPTKDGYILTVHRLIHPEDQERGRPKPRTKKPYLLLHGLIGSSSSFLRNSDWRYKAPKKTFDGFEAVRWSITTSRYDTKVQCSAQLFKEAFKGDKTATIENLSIKNRLLNVWPERDFCQIKELDFDGDALIWGPEFKQAYRKFELNKQAKEMVSNSLAYTLSNFGYDVWLLNLRGNYYSKEHQKFNPKQEDFWQFDIGTLIEHDLPAMIESIKEITQFKEPIGLVSYSYSALHVLGLLSKYPAYQETLQPVVMMAPAILTSKNSHLTMKYFMKIMSKAFMKKHGPFPVLGHSSNDETIEKLICKLPIASRLCHLLETILHGKTDNISEVSKILINDHRTSLMKKDIDCGQTSLAVLHQIIENLNDSRINPKYKPWEVGRRLILAKKFKPIRRSVMVLHSKDDDISNMEEVEKILDSSLKSMALVNHLITYPKFDHADFLFSKSNQYLVNAEIARMTTLFDYMMYAEPANRPKNYTPLNTEFLL